MGPTVVDRLWLVARTMLVVDVVSLFTFGAVFAIACTALFTPVLLGVKGPAATACAVGMGIVSSGTHLVALLYVLRWRRR